MKTTKQRLMELAGVITEGAYKQKLSENENSIGIGKQPILNPKQQKEYQDSLIKMFYDDLNDPYEGGAYSAVSNLSHNTELIIANLLSGYKPLNDDWWGQEDWNWENDNPKHPYNVLKSKGYDLESIKDLMDSKLKEFERNSTSNPKIKDIQSYIKAASDTGLNEAQVYELDRAVKDKAAYKRFIDAIDVLLDDWYAAGFTKDDVVEYMSKILPETK